MFVTTLAAHSDFLENTRGGSVLVSFGVTQRVTEVGVATLTLAAFGATILPARRAATLDPVRALRQA